MAALWDACSSLSWPERRIRRQQGQRGKWQYCGRRPWLVRFRVAGDLSNGERTGVECSDELNMLAFLSSLYSLPAPPSQVTREIIGNSRIPGMWTSPQYQRSLGPPNSLGDGGWGDSLATTLVHGRMSRQLRTALPKKWRGDARSVTRRVIV
ncbi:hypothetical protein FRB94_012995 [Tulasnella sp. JGI-2019a]|nr:hypothetical protein FRB93_001722 [Tulasnella sp. JGI-2019a]KAG9008770.1 hypothetical protein FRB94_012995 [Tulasnella sp. JGI-2019a]